MAKVTHEQKLALAVIRFANHAEDRSIKLPLWASLLWDEVIGLAREVELPDHIAASSDPPKSTTQGQKG